MPETTGDRALRQAWELSYRDPQATAAGVRVWLANASATPVAARRRRWGWLHLALAEARSGTAVAAADALGRAREAFDADGQDDRGVGLRCCDEVEAIGLRRGGDVAAARRLLAAIDAGTASAAAGESPEETADDEAAEVPVADGAPPPSMLAFLGHDSRALAAWRAGASDDALRHFLAAGEAAERCGWLGPRMAAAASFGAFHQDLHHLDDACRLTTQALELADRAGAWQALAEAAGRLMLILHALGLPLRARALVDFVEQRRDRLGARAASRLAPMLALGHLGAGETTAAWRWLQQAGEAAAGDGEAALQRAWLTGRCLLAQGDAHGARAVAERALAQQTVDGAGAAPALPAVELLRLLADACEATGDAAAALAGLRRAQALFERLVARGARAQCVALEVSHRLARAQRERDRALDSRRSAEDDRRRLTALNQALQSQVAETERLHAQLRDQALRDPLTGLHNRRYLFEVGPGLLELSRRNRSPLCVVLMDLDHFKRLNDTHGHETGDQVLRRFGTLLTEGLRKSDVVCRHGGEEFVALMPDMEADGAHAVLARLLDALGQPPPPLPGQRPLPAVSFSAGVARFPRHGHTLEQLIACADRALYAAKDAGRSRIELVPKTEFGSLV